MAGAVKSKSTATHTLDLREDVLQKRQHESNGIQESATDVDPSEDLDQQFEINLREIKRRYSAFVTDLCNCITSKGVSVVEFRIFLLSMSAFEDEGDEQHCMLLSRVREKLEKAESISDIFSFVREWASFLNDDIFQSIMERYNIPKDHESLKYSEHLHEYLLKHELSYFTKINPRPEKLEEIKKGMASENTLRLKVNNERLCRIAHVVNLKRTVAIILRVKVSALRLIDIGKGCVEVTFLVPALLPDILFGRFPRPVTLATRLVEQFQELSIEWMKCGEHEVDFRCGVATSFQKKTAGEMETEMCDWTPSMSEHEEVTTLAAKGSGADTMEAPVLDKSKNCIKTAQDAYSQLQKGSDNADIITYLETLTEDGKYLQMIAEGFLTKLAAQEQEPDKKFQQLSKDKAQFQIHGGRFTEERES